MIIAAQVCHRVQHPRRAVVQAVSRCGGAARSRWRPAILWTVVIGARAAFSYGAEHWFQGPLVSWAIAHQVSLAALTDGLIFMAVVMVLVRTIGLGVRASHVPTDALAPQSR
jgi:hypothetical protein